MPDASLSTFSLIQPSQPLYNVDIINIFNTR